MLDEVFDDRVTAMVNEAERTEIFPRALLDKLGAAGVFRAKWAGATRPDVAKLFELGYRLGRTASTGIGVGVSLHDSGIATLRRFGKTDYLTALAERAIDATEVLCIGASEESGGSDLQISQTLVTPEASGGAAGYRVRGRKKFCSLSPIAGHMIAVGRSAEDGSTQGNNVVVAVPMDGPGVVVGSPPARSTPPPSTSTRGFPKRPSSRAPAPGWRSSAGGSRTSDCRWPRRSRRPATSSSASRWPG